MDILVDFLLVLLLVVLIAPPVVLAKREKLLSWSVRYLLSVLPVAYTWLGWKAGVLAFDLFGCKGNMKGFGSCFSGETDVTSLVGYGHFLMIPFAFIALPLSLWLLLNTAAKQLGEWHGKQIANDMRENAKKNSGQDSTE